MKKVITYGTYDLLHYGHISLLKRAKALGDYLIVGVTTDDYDKTRGKINVQQSLMERVEAVRSTGIADEIIIEEYEGQKIDDIRRYDVDIFTVGSDWVGHFDYLKEYCEVVYLDRTEGVSSSEIRSSNNLVRIGLVGDSDFLIKIFNESSFVNGIIVSGVCTDFTDSLPEALKSLPIVTSEYSELLDAVDAVYIRSSPEKHYQQIKAALLAGNHVLCESPVTVSIKEYDELMEIAKNRGLILMEAIKTAYSLAYQRLLLLLKEGIIGDIVSIDSTCTSLRNNSERELKCLYEWGPTALLPVFHFLGFNYKNNIVTAKYNNKEEKREGFLKSDFIYSNAVASIKIGDCVKSEGELIISGSKGYVYIPAPWWKTDYFEIRFENSTNNRRYFYQLEGEGIRYELVAFLRSINRHMSADYIPENVTRGIIGFMEDYINRKEIFEI